MVLNTGLLDWESSTLTTRPFGSNRKIVGVPSFGGKRSCLKRIRGYNTGKDEGGSRHSFTSNDKNNVIAENLLSSFVLFKLQV